MPFSDELPKPYALFFGVPLSLTQLAAKRLFDIFSKPLRPVLIISRMGRSGGGSLFCEATNILLISLYLCKLIVHLPRFHFVTSFLFSKKQILIVKLVHFDSNSKRVIGVFCMFEFWELSWYGVRCLIQVCYPHLSPSLGASR